MTDCFMCLKKLTPEYQIYNDKHVICLEELEKRVGNGKCAYCGKTGNIKDINNYCGKCDRIWKGYSDLFRTL